MRTMDVPARQAEALLHERAGQRPEGPSRRDWQISSILIGALAVLYGLLHNPYWVPGGDSEVYLAIARNLVTGQGYIFNGQPVGMVPPGWPVVLAGAMMLTDSFAWLKLLPMTMMLGFWAVAYWILRRFATAAITVLIIGICALLSYVVPLTFWFHSDALFSLLSAGALLLAMQINENRGGAWRIAALVALCAAAVTVRWTGALGWGLVAAALVSGQLVPRLNRQWLALLLSGVVCTGVFLGLREMTRVTPQPATAVHPVPDQMVDPAPAHSVRDPGKGEVVPAMDDAVAASYELASASAKVEYVRRLIDAGHWFGWLFWQPFRIGSAWPPVERAGMIIGWILIALLVVPVVQGIRHRQWIWPALAGYCGVLVLIWPNPNARYMVPVSLLILLGVLKGGVWVASLSANLWWRRLTMGALATLLLSVLLVNGAIYAVEVQVARSNDFYGIYEAGLNRDLIAAAHYLSQQDVRDGQIAVSERYENLGRSRISRFGLRATTMLTDTAVASVPPPLARGPNTRLAGWAEEHGVRYYLYQPPVNPWRLWHFRVPWLQQRLSGQPESEEEAGWQLYEFEGKHWRRLPVSAPPDWPQRVPGM